MTLRSASLLAAFTVAVLALAGAATSSLSTTKFHAAGPPPGRTGGFGEQTCSECHAEYEENLPGGRVQLLGLPEAYAPGTSYALTVRLESEGMVNAGFQLAARFEEGPDRGLPAGVLSALDARVAVTPDSTGTNSYAHHTGAGSAATDPDVVIWLLEWTSPEDGKVAFHVAANSANGDDSPLGDLIYTTVARAGSLGMGPDRRTRGGVTR